MSRWDAASDLDYFDDCRWPRPAQADGPRTQPTRAERLARDLDGKKTPAKIVPPRIKGVA